MANDPTKYGKKAAAVQQWRDVLDELPDDEEWADHLRDANIHNRRARKEIEETIRYEADEEHYGALEDAWHDLKQSFTLWK